MKVLCNFYIVDVVAESVVGGFQAPNLLLAKRIFSEMLENNEKLKKYPDSYVLRVDNSPVDVPETYEDVIGTTEEVK